MCFLFLLCQEKIPDEKNTRDLYLLGKNINKPLVCFYRLHLPPFWVSSSIRPSTIPFFLERNWITTMLLFYMRENNLGVKQKCVILFNKLFLNLIVYYFEPMSKTIVAINQSILPSVHVWVKMTPL